MHLHFAQMCEYENWVQEPREKKNNKEFTRETDAFIIHCALHTYEMFFFFQWEIV